MVEKLTRKEQREQGRIERKEKLEAAKKAKKKRLISTIVISTLTVVVSGGLIAFGIIASQPVEQLNPKNMLNDGVTLSKGLKVMETAAIKKDAEPTPLELRDDRVEVEIYLDYLCPYCNKFDVAQRSVIEEYLQKDDIVFSFHPMAFLSEYSMLATNASACIAAEQPDLWWKANNLLYDAQPEEKTAQAFSSKQSQEAITEAFKTLSLNDKVVKCMKDVPYGKWSVDATNRVLKGGKVPNSTLEKIEGTPTIIIDGVQFTEDATSPNFKIALDNALANIKKS
jgi:protein-disulfide isomerase